MAAASEQWKERAASAEVVAALAAAVAVLVCPPAAERAARLLRFQAAVRRTKVEARGCVAAAAGLAVADRTQKRDYPLDAPSNQAEPVGATW